MFRLAFYLGLLCAEVAFSDPMPAVGRLEHVIESGTCSAVLIAPDLVMTAGHCAGQDPSVIRFRPSGSSEDAVFQLQRIAAHPFYDPDQERPNWKIRFDLKLARLETPVPDWVATPIPVGEPARPGERLFLVSWRRSEGPQARQRACPVIEGATGIVTLGCQVNGGESGSPVLRKKDQGLELVAIVSSRSAIRNQPVALATDVRLRLQPLLDALD